LNEEEYEDDYDEFEHEDELEEDEREEYYKDENDDDTGRKPRNRWKSIYSGYGFRLPY
jgi:hypothetical protein